MNYIRTDSIDVTSEIPNSIWSCHALKEKKNLVFSSFFPLKLLGHNPITLPEGKHFDR